MTVSQHRRRMSTTRAVVASVTGVALALALGVTGAVAIYNTKDGQVQGSDAPEVPFPTTPTGAVAVLDDNGALASLVVLTVRPATDGDDAGVGGTVVPIPVSADVSGGTGSERLPIDETVALFGGSSLDDELPALLGLSFDQIAVIAEAELAAMLDPLGPTELTLPTAVAAADGTVVTDAGAQTLTGPQMATLLAARDPDLTGAEEYEADVAVWRAVAGSVGAGLATPLTLDVERPTAPVSGAESIGELVGRLTSGPMSVQALRSDPIVSIDLNPRGVDAVALDRVEVAVIFGHVAPSRVAAPYAGYTYRVVSAFSDDQLPIGVDRLDVAYTATKALVGLDANVRSVSTDAGDAQSSTIVEVTNDSLLPAGELLGDIFGPVEVRVADTRITGIDMVVSLGTDYLTTLDTGAAGSTALDEAVDVTDTADVDAATTGTGTGGVSDTNGEDILD